MGVEEEFLLVEPGSGLPASAARAVLDRVVPGELAEGARVERELWDTEVEASTGVCTTLTAVREALTRHRAALGRAARAEGLELVAVGLPVFGAETAPPNRDGHYRWMGDAYGLVLSDQEFCSCHVHVGVADREVAVAVLNHLRPWLPTLSALTADSPFRRGRDTGFQSWRTVAYTRLPASGVPPWFGSLAEHDADLARLGECGLLPRDHGGLRLARLSGHLPTVEVRVADAVPSVDEAVLHAALVRGLVRTALDELASGREADRPADGVLGQALWTAARHGLAGPAIDPWTGAPTSPHAMAARLLRRVEPALTATGDLAGTRSLLHGVLRHGNGAVRQRRAAAEGGIDDALSLLIRETTAAHLSDGG
ncbi:glutamate--cysteine ligase [Actinosynnema sp. NPDC053489]|uniref:glutamate--cysteine ligase n=1 Tax=Actinosynnema sp. NPDC053489 TaxID=3363916 RepID=UPI0037C654AB